MLAPSWFQPRAPGDPIESTTRNSVSISGLVVEYVVAIDVTRVRFPADALFRLRSWPPVDQISFRHTRWRKAHVSRCLIRLAVRTPRCGRGNPGSNPGLDTLKNFTHVNDRPHLAFESPAAAVRPPSVAISPLLRQKGSKVRPTGIEPVTIRSTVERSTN